MLLSGLGHEVIENAPFMEGDVFIGKGLFKIHRTGISVLSKQRMVSMSHRPDLILLEGPELKSSCIDGVIEYDHVGDIFAQKFHALSGEYLLHCYLDFRVILSELANNRRQNTVQSPGNRRKPQLTRLAFGKALQIGSYLCIFMQQLPAVFGKDRSCRRQICPGRSSDNQ